MWQEQLVENQEQVVAKQEQLVPKQTSAGARKQPASREILLWMTPSEAPKALQA